MLGHGMHPPHEPPPPPAPLLLLRQAMRLFVGEPVWTPHNRPQYVHPSRAKYLEKFGKASTSA